MKRFLLIAALLLPAFAFGQALPRKTQSVFGSGLTPTGNVANFGTYAAGAVTYSNDPAAIQTSAWLNGWNGAVVGNQSPTIQDMNAVMLVLSQQIAYLLQQGIPQWDSTGGTSYYLGSEAKVSGQVYQCYVTGPVTSNPSTDTASWKPFTATQTGPNLIKASVVFDGINSTGGFSNIISSFNVTSVQKLGTGSYLVNFTAGLPVDGSGNGIYGLAGSAGTQNGQVSGSGDNNIICGGGVPGTTVTKTATQCSVYCWEANFSGSGALENSGCITINFY